MSYPVVVIGGRINWDLGILRPDMESGIDRIRSGTYRNMLLREYNRPETD